MGRGALLDTHEHGAHGDGGGWRGILVHWLTGLFFAWILSVAIVMGLGQYVGLGNFFRAIEEKGIDATMRLRNALSPTARSGAEVEGRRLPTDGVQPAGYVFIDLDAQTCREAEGDDPRCDGRSPASGAAAARVANALLAAPPYPKVIILDVRLWNVDPTAKPAPDLETLLTERAARAPVLAPAPAAPTGEDRRVVIDWNQAPEAIRNSPIRFAPAVTWPDGPDAVVRRYPASVHAELTKAPPDILTGKVVRVASLPYLASLYATGQAANCVADRVHYKFPECDLELPAVAGAAEAAGETHHAGHGDRTGGRTLFTIKGAGENSGGTRIVSSEAIFEKGGLRISRPTIANKVVVIGYSGPKGLDRHATPLGEMSGAELILNAVRSFASKSQIQHGDWRGTALRELIAASVSSVPFFLFWAVKAWVWRRIHGAPPPARPRDSASLWPAALRAKRGDFNQAWTTRRASPTAGEVWRALVASCLHGLRKALRLRPGMIGRAFAALASPDAIAGLRRLVAVVLIAGLFLLTTGASAVITTSVLAISLAPLISEGVPVDVLLPVAILALESFAHAAKYVLDFLHGVVGAALWSLCDAIAACALALWRALVTVFVWVTGRGAEPAPAPTPPSAN